MKSHREIIRELREDSDLTQTDIANALGTTQQHYSKYETGEYELPLRALVILADYYKVSADYLLGRTLCREGVASLNTKVDPEYTIGEVISDILSLDTAGRAYVLKSVFLQRQNQFIQTKGKTHRIHRTK
jgi:transcriptional regulator with XRE-family HTH domain